MQNILDENNITDIVLSEDCKEGSVATYDFSTKVLEVNENSLLKHAEKHGLCVKDMAYLIISHELGHYLDKDLEDLYNKRLSVFNRIHEDVYTCDFQTVIDEGSSYILQAEKNAWTLGERFVPNHLIDKYKEFEKRILKKVEVNAIAEIEDFISKVKKLKELNS